MRRYAIEELKNWKNSPNRKPLMLSGARQVGKTWLVREFAVSEYTDYIELNFFSNNYLKSIFGSDITPKYIIEQLESIFLRKIDPTKTLLFFDEIQESQRALDSLKTFNDLAPEYNIIAAGSFLGVMMGSKPVGQTNHITMYPMSFYEFLEAVGHEQLVKALRVHEKNILNDLSYLLTKLLKQYYFVGGMPEAVLEFATSGNLDKVREIQNRILIDFNGDFTKHIGLHDIPKVNILWNSIPIHLVKEKKKFIYKEIKAGARASAFENAMQWLVNTGLVYKINRVHTPKIPLASYQSFGIFKLYMLDIGLFCAKAEVSPRDIFEPNTDITDNFNGALAEQFVCQELKTAGVSPLFYWGREKGDAELDFITQYNGEVIPIEVKSAKNTKAKSLQVYRNAYNPARVVRTSLRNFGVENGLYSIPLYLIVELTRIISL